MRVAKALAGATAAAVTTVLAVTMPASAAGTTAVNYVALGDSYASGVGAGDYDPDSGDCRRSPHAFSPLYAQQSGATLNFQSCSGATTDTVMSGQISAVNADTGLVSISIGGNDAGFVPTLEDCITGGDSGCKDSTDKAIAYVHNELPAKLDTVYSAISGQAPSAKVVVLGYPHIYQIGGSCSVGLSDTSRGYINNAADELDAAIAERASAHGFAFGDTRPAFTGHEICSDDSWLHSVTFPVNDSYHPTAAGQSGGYLPTFTSALG